MTHLAEYMEGQILLKERLQVKKQAKKKKKWIEDGTMELLKIETRRINGVSAYRSSNDLFMWPRDLVLGGKERHLIVGDF